jgi:hypothetical protein
VGALVLVAALAVGALPFFRSNGSGDGRTSVASGRTSPSQHRYGSDLGGWLVADDRGAVFLQWTRSGGQLTGSATVARLAKDDTSVEEASAGFEGVIANGSVSLHFSSWLGGSTWNGKLDGDKLTLSYPDSDGRLQVADFRPSDLAAYRDRVSHLEAYAANVVADRDSAQAEAARAQQDARDRQREQEEAAARAVLEAFRSTCRERGGTLTTQTPNELGYDAFSHINSAHEWCSVSFAGQGSFAVPVSRRDGAFDQESVDLNREQCAADAEDARINAADGYPWARQPEYHARQGVCYRGER